MRIALSIVLLLSLLLNAALARYLLTNNAPPVTKKSDATLPFLSKRIFIDNNNDILINFTELRSQLRAYVEGADDLTAVYFEYLPSGISIGVNEKEEFFPASLLKVPIAMAVYKNIEERKIHKNTVIAIKPAYIDASSGEIWKAGAGATITVDTAIRETLIASDNTAKNALLSVLSKEDIEFVFDSLDIDKASYENNTFITAKNYASVLRSLYLSSYLTKEHSNEILQILTNSHETNKIRAGIPAEIPVAHKFGIAKAGKNIQPLHSDCGIVYIPKRPYILCIMMQTSEEKSQAVMREIAAITYQYVAKTQRKP